MLGRPRRLAATVIAVVAATFLVLGQSGPLTGSEPSQSGANDPEISEKECAFWLDHDSDGKGDERISGDYILQESSVVGGCDFKLNSPESATLVVESELTDWEAEVEIKREPGSTEDYKIYPGLPEIPEVDGSMRVIVNFVAGDTPRSGRTRTLDDDYLHQVQIPDEFRILGVTVTIPDGRNDRLEENAWAASSEYINADRNIAQQEGELPQWAVALSQEWLEKGYPQVAASIIEQESDGGASGLWKWAAIVTWIAILIAVIIAIVLYIFLSKGSRSDGPRPPDGL